MGLPYFVSFILVLTLGWMQMFWTAQEHFNGVREYQKKVSDLKESLAEEKLKTKIANEDFLDFRQSVAALMPKTLPLVKGPSGAGLRGLASVLAPLSNEDVKEILSRTLFKRGQDLFRDKKFNEANHVFKTFIEHYSYSEHAPEAYFLWLDGSYQLGNYQETVEVSRQMIELFPGTELTGFGLLRLGRVYEIQGRAGDAVDIYKTVIRSYRQPDVADQARKSLKSLDL
jgi:TolA-binding protein